MSKRLKREIEAKARAELKRRRARGLTALKVFNQNYEIIRQNARNNGYAIAVHGSLLRDVDLVAIPWVREAAAPRRMFLDLVRLLKALYRDRGVYASKRCVRKPHRRVAYVIHVGGTYIDLSIIRPI